MKLNRIMIASFVLLAILTFGTVSANDNLTANETLDTPELGVDDAVDLSDDNQINDSTSKFIEKEELKDVNESDDILQSNGTEDANIELSVSSEILKGNFLYVSFTNPGDFKGNVNIFIDNKCCDILELTPHGQGWQAVDVENPTLGIHTGNLVYEGNDQYKAFNQTFEFEVSNVIFNLYEKMYQTDSISAAFSSDATGTVTMNINGTTKRYNLKDYHSYDGIYISYELDDLKCGETYPVEIIYSGNYGKIIKKQNVTIDYKMYFYTSLALSLTDYLNHYNDEFIFFEVYAGGDIRVLIDGKDINYDKTKDKPGTYSRSPNYYDGCIFDYAPIWLNELALSKGYHTIELMCLGNDYFPAKSIKETFYLENSIFPHSGLINKPLNIFFSENTTGNVSAYLSHDGKKYTLVDFANITNNTANINLNASPGTNYIKLVSNTNYGIEELNRTYEAIFANLVYQYWYDRIITPSSDYKYSDTFKLECAKGVTGKLSIYIKDGNTNKETLYKQVNIANGIAKINVPNTAYSKKVGKYYLVARWNTNYGKGSETSNFIVVKLAIKAPVSSVSYTGKYSVTVDNGYGGPIKGASVTFYINGKKVKTVKTNKKGVAAFNIPAKYNPGKYTIKAVAFGKAVSKKVTVKQILSVKTVKVKKSAKKLVITATLKKVNGKYLKGKTLKLKFNGKTYTAKTNKKGVAKFTIKKSALKKLKVGKKITYKATYIKNTVKKTVKVKK